MQTVNLKPFNSFSIAASCDNFLRFTTSDSLSSWIREHKPQPKQLLIIGGGSNLLLIGHIELTFLQADIQGVTYQEDPKNCEKVLVKAGAGVNWHQLVLDTLDNDLYGLENLSLIPGNVGASPIQNIGAYGVELKDVFVELEAVEIATGKLKRFKKQDCEFAYRHSIFKGQLRGQYVITSVTLALTKEANYQLDYGPLRKEFSANSQKEISSKEISDAVIRIRTSKLPDPKELGNAGSFFKNPIVSEQQFFNLKDKFSDIVAYPVENGQYKLAAGWLIEKAGLKGFRLGDAGVHKKQALVLVNYGDASGQDILMVAKKVRDSVQQKFRVELEPEVWLIGEQNVF